MKTISFYAVICDDEVIARFPSTTDIFEVIKRAKILKNQGHKVFVKKYKAESNHPIMKELITIAATIAALSSCASNKDTELLNAYKAYYIANEALLDSLDIHYDFMDTTGLI